MLNKNYTRTLLVLFEALMLVSVISMFLPCVSAANAETAVTEMQCFAFARLSYGSLKLGTVREQFTANQWEQSFDGKSPVTREILYGGIQDWEVIYTHENSATGFYAAAFRKEGSPAQIVIAYRGSTTFGKQFTSSDGKKDWWWNDYAMQVFNNPNTKENQIDDAISFYEQVRLMYSGTDTQYTLTGHSLGGGLADIISAMYNVDAVSFNPIGILQCGYARYPEVMAASFTGHDQWRFVDHVNEDDWAAGTWGIEYKRYYKHKDLGGSVAHSMRTFVQVDGSRAVMSEITGQYDRNDKEPIEYHNCIWGTSGNDIIKAADALNLQVFPGIGRDEVNLHYSESCPSTSVYFKKDDSETDRIYTNSGACSVYLIGYEPTSSISICPTRNGTNIETTVFIGNKPVLTIDRKTEGTITVRLNDRRIDVSYSLLLHKLEIGSYEFSVAESDACEPYTVNTDGAYFMALTESGFENIRPVEKGTVLSPTIEVVDKNGDSYFCFDDGLWFRAEMSDSSRRRSEEVNAYYRVTAANDRAYVCEAPDGDKVDNGTLHEGDILFISEKVTVKLSNRETVWYRISESGNGPTSQFSGMYVSEMFLEEAAILDFSAVDEYCYVREVYGGAKAYTDWNTPRREVGTLTTGSMLHIDQRITVREGTGEAVWCRINGETGGFRHCNGYFVRAEDIIDRDNVQPEPVNGYYRVTDTNGTAKTYSEPFASDGTGSFSYGEIVYITEKVDAFSDTKEQLWYRIGEAGSANSARYAGRYIAAACLEDASYTSETSVGQEYTVLKDRSAVRIYPSKYADVVRTVDRYDTVQVQSSAVNRDGNTWYRLGEREWIFCENVSEHSYTVNAYVDQEMRANRNNTPVHSMPWDESKENNIVSTLAGGETVTVDMSVTNSSGNMWYRIGENKWVYGEYLVIVPTITATPSPRPTPTALITPTPAPVITPTPIPVQAPASVSNGYDLNDACGYWVANLMTMSGDPTSSYAEYEYVVYLEEADDEGMFIMFEYAFDADYYGYLTLEGPAEGVFIADAEYYDGGANTLSGSVSFDGDDLIIVINWVEWDDYDLMGERIVFSYLEDASILYAD